MWCQNESFFKAKCSIEHGGTSAFSHIFYIMVPDTGAKIRAQNSSAQCYGIILRFLGNGTRGSAEHPSSADFSRTMRSKSFA